MGRAKPPSIVVPTRQISAPAATATISLRTITNGHSVGTDETKVCPRTDTTGRSAEALDDGGVGHAAALAHRLQAVTAAGALELVHQRGHELGAGAAERVTERDGAAVRVHLAHVGVVLLLPGEHDRREGLVDLGHVDLVDR